MAAGEEGLPWCPAQKQPAQVWVKVKVSTGFRAPHIEGTIFFQTPPWSQGEAAPKTLQELRLWTTGAHWRWKSWAGDKQVQVPRAQEGGQGLWKKKVVSELGSAKAGTLHPQETECDPKAKTGIKPISRALWECTEMGLPRHKVVGLPFLQTQAKTLTQGVGTGRLT